MIKLLNYGNIIPKKIPGIYHDSEQFITILCLICAIYHRKYEKSHFDFLTIFDKILICIFYLKSIINYICFYAINCCRVFF